MSAGAGDPNAGSKGSVPLGGASASSIGDGEQASDGERGSGAVSAGRVGRAHGLDGSFYVTGARARLLAVGTKVRLDGSVSTVVRRAGTDEHPIVRLDEVHDRPAAEALRGRELTVELAQAPALQEGEWWAQELVGCEVFDGQRHVGMVIGLLELPSCEALEVRIVALAADTHDKSTGSSAGQLLVPMVSDAIRHVDTKQRRIDVDMAFLGED